MDLCVYKNRCVKLDTSKGYYYLGLVLSVDEDSITLEDKNKRLVTLKIVDVVNVREVLQ
jgi:hypothetical protein